MSRQDSDNIDKKPDNDVSVDNNLRILYITFAIIIGLMLLWIIIVVFTKEDPLKILGEMNNLASQIPPVSDNKLSFQSQNTPILPEGYVGDTSTPPI